MKSNALFSLFETMNDGLFRQLETLGIHGGGPCEPPHKFSTEVFEWGFSKMIDPLQLPQHIQR